VCERKIRAKSERVRKMAGRIQNKRAQPEAMKEKATAKLKRTKKTEKLEAGVTHLVLISEDSFIMDPAYQMRGKRGPTKLAVLDTENIERLATAFVRDGELKEPIKLFRINNRAGGFKSCVVVDGFHRLEALRRAGAKKVKAIITDGTKKEAIKEAARANTEHGLPVRKKDERNTLKSFMDAGCYQTAEGHLEITAIKDTLRFTASDRTMRRWIQADTPSIYSKYYAEAEDRKEKDKREPRVRKPEHMLEADGLIVEAGKLIRDLEADGGNEEAMEAAAKLRQFFLDSVERLEDVGDEFARARKDVQPF